MSEPYRWQQYGDSAAIDTIEQLIGQTTRDITMPYDELCNDIAACLGESDEVQKGVLQIANDSGQLATQGGSATNPLSDSVQEADLLPDTFQCDRDHAYAMARGIVWAIHSATTEVFQLIEVTSNPVELAAELADNVPGFGIIGGTAMDMVLWIQESAAEAYELAWSESVWDSIACEIFCHIMRTDGCSINYFELVAIYARPFTDIPATGSTLADIMDYLANLAITYNEAGVKACGLVGLVFMQFGGKFGQFLLGIRSLKQTLLFLSNDTDPDWTTCTECPENRWGRLFDFTVDNGGFAVTAGHNNYVAGSYEVGVGWKSGYNNKVTGVTIKLPVGEATRITLLGYRYNLVRGSSAISGSPYNVVRTWDDPANYQTAKLLGLISSGQESLWWSGSEDIAATAEIHLQALAHVNYGESSANGSTVIWQCVVEGYGDAPSWADPDYVWD